MIDKAEAVRRTAEFARTRHAGSQPCHDFSHVERVLALAERLGQDEGADLFVLRLAALLHDIGRGIEGRIGPEPDRHEELSAELAGPFLAGLGLPGETVSAVLEAIVAHRHRRGRLPGTVEARCLFDADKLDSLGAVGVARAYLWLGEHGRSVHYPPESWAGVDPSDNATENDSLQREWEIKLSRLKDGMFTRRGKAMAGERSERMERILKEIDREVSGEA